MELPDEVPNYYSILGEDWTLLEVSRDLAAAIGREPADMVGRDGWEFTAPPSRGRLSEYMAGQLSAGEVVTGIVDLLHAGGGWIPYAYETVRAWMDKRFVYVSRGVVLSGSTVAGWDRLDGFISRLESLTIRWADNRYMTVPESCEYTTLGPDKLREWVAAGTINRYGTRGKVTYLRSELDAAMAKAWRE